MAKSSLFQIAKLSFNFNLNLIEGWDDLTLDFSNHPTNQTHCTKLVFKLIMKKKLIMNHQKRGKPNWTLTCAWHNFSHSLFLSLLSIMNNSTAALHIPHKPFPHLEQMSRSCFFHDSLVYLRPYLAEALLASSTQTQTSNTIKLGLFNVTPPTTQFFSTELHYYGTPLSQERITKPFQAENIRLKSWI